MDKDTRKYKTVSVTWATWDALKRRAASEGRTVSGLVSLLVREAPIEHVRVPTPAEAQRVLQAAIDAGVVTVE